MKNSQEMWAGPVRCNDKKLRQLIRENSIVRKLHPGEYYLSPGDPIYYVAYVASGVTSHYMFSANGREKVLYRLGTGWFFSEGIFYNENGSIEVATRYAIAEEETTLWLITRSISSSCWKTGSLWRQSFTVRWRSVRSCAMRSRV